MSRASRWIRLSSLVALVFGVLLSSQAQAGWTQATGQEDPEGKWEDEGKASDGDAALYAIDKSNRVGDGAWLVLNFQKDGEGIESNRLRVNADFWAPIADKLRIEVRYDGENEFVNVNIVDGVVPNAVYAEFVLPKEGKVNAIRVRWHYVKSGYWFWLYDIQLFEVEPPPIDPPQGETLEPSSVNLTSAVLRGRVKSDGGGACQTRFVYGTDAALPADSPATAWTGSFGADDEFTAFVKDLTPGAAYYYRAEVKNTAAARAGMIESFTACAEESEDGSVWVSPNGSATDAHRYYYDPNDATKFREYKWTDGGNAHDDWNESAARCYHEIHDPELWSPWLTFSTQEMLCGGVRFKAAKPDNYIEKVQVEVLSSTWYQVYDGSFTHKEFEVCNFELDRVLGARIRFKMSQAGVGAYWNLYEFDFQQVGVNLIVPGLAYYKEEDPGARIVRNVAVPLAFKFGPRIASYGAGVVKVVFTSRLKLYVDEGCTQELATDVGSATTRTYDLADTGQRQQFQDELLDKTLYVRASENSPALRDSWVQCEFIHPEVTAADKVVFTVMGEDPDLDVDSNNDGALTTADDTPAGAEMSAPGFIVPVRDWSAGPVPLASRPSARITATPAGLTSIKFRGGGYTKYGNITKYKWKFGDGQTSTDQNPTHTYASPGDNQATLTITVSFEGSSLQVQATTSLSVLVQPVVRLWPFAPAGETVSGGTLSVSVDHPERLEAFDEAGNTVLDSAHSSYVFKDSGGSPVDKLASLKRWVLRGTAPGPVELRFEYRKSDSYVLHDSVKVTVVQIDADVDANNNQLLEEDDDSFEKETPGFLLTQASWSSAANGDEHVPSAIFEVAPRGRLKFRFDAGSSFDTDGMITSYAWDFGDAHSRTGSVSEHTFDAPGTYRISLTVTDNDGNTKSCEMNLLVQLPLVIRPFSAPEGLSGGTLKLSVDKPHCLTVYDESGNTLLHGLTTEHTFRNSGGNPVDSLAGELNYCLRGNRSGTVKVTLAYEKGSFTVVDEVCVSTRGIDIMDPANNDRGDHVGVCTARPLLATISAAGPLAAVNISNLQVADAFGTVRSLAVSAGSTGTPTVLAPNAATEHNGRFVISSFADTNLPVGASEPWLKLVATNALGHERVTIVPLNLDITRSTVISADFAPPGEGEYSLPAGEQFKVQSYLGESSENLVLSVPHKHEEDDAVIPAGTGIESDKLKELIVAVDAPVDFGGVRAEHQHHMPYVVVEFSAPNASVIEVSHTSGVKDSVTALSTTWRDAAGGDRGDHFGLCRSRSVPASISAAGPLSAVVLSNLTVADGFGTVRQVVLTPEGGADTVLVPNTASAHNGRFVISSLPNATVAVNPNRPNLRVRVTNALGQISTTVLPLTLDSARNNVTGIAFTAPDPASYELCSGQILRLIALSNAGPPVTLSRPFKREDAAGEISAGTLIAIVDLAGSVVAVGSAPDFGTVAVTNRHHVPYVRIDYGIAGGSNITVTRAAVSADTAVAVSVNIEEVAFNHTSASHTGDALNIRRNLTTTIDVPEYVRGTRNLPAAYVMSRSVSVWARLTVRPTTLRHVRLLGNSCDANGALGDVNAKGIVFSGGNSREGTDNPATPIREDRFVVLAVAGNTPAEVRKSTECWQWVVARIDGNGIASCPADWSDGHTVFTTLSAPTTPWNQTAGNQRNPWSDVLSFACEPGWAGGATDAPATLSRITEALYYRGNCHYDTYQGGSLLGWPDLNLTAFLGHLGTLGDSLRINCHDAGRIVTALGDVLGCDTQWRRLAPMGALAGSALNCIDAIGPADISPPTNNCFATRSEVHSSYAERFALVAGQTLLVRLGGGAVRTVTFNASDFADITRARPSEVRTAMLRSLGDRIRTYLTSQSAGFQTGVAPFALADGQTLMVRFNDGAVQTVTFRAADFTDITAATATEVSAVLNSRLTLPAGIGIGAIGGPRVAFLTTAVVGNSIAITGGTACGALGLVAGRVAVTERITMVNPAGSVEFTGGTALGTLGFPVGVQLPSEPAIHHDGRTGGFGNHGVCVRTDPAGTARVYDAVLRYDIDADPDNVTGSNPAAGTANPTGGFTWELPRGVDINTYWNRLADDWHMGYPGGGRPAIPPVHPEVAWTVE
jgi:PKD repeat protein